MKGVALDYQQPSFVLALPDKISQVLLGVYLLVSQWNPCDATGVMTGHSLTLIVLGLALGFCTAAARVCNTTYTDAPLLWKSLVIVYCTWLAICELLALAAGNNGQTALLGFWQTIAIVGVTVSCIHHASDPVRLATLTRWMIGLASGSSAYALYQYFVSMPRLRAQFREDPTPFLRSEGIENGTAMALQFYNRIMSAEPMGPFNLTNSLAGFVGPWLIVALLAIGVYAFRTESKLSFGSRENTRKATENSTHLWVSFVVIIVLLGLGLLLTKSRTAWLASLAGLALIAISSGSSIVPRKSYGLVGAVFLILLMPFGFVVWRDPLIFWEAGKSLAYRADYWNGALQLIGRSPWVGYGSLNFQSVYPHVKSMTASETPADPHNMWIEIAIDSGLPGLMIAIFIATYICMGIARRWMIRRQLHNDGESVISQNAAPVAFSWMGIGFMVAAVATLLMTLLFSADTDTIVCCFLFITVASLVAFAFRTEFWLQFVKSSSPMIGLLLCSVLGLHLCFSGGWMQPGAMNTMAIAVAIIVSGRSKSNENSTGVLQYIPAISFVCWMIGCGAFAYSTYTPEVRLAQWETEMQFTDPMQLDLESIKSAVNLHPNSPGLADRILGICSMRIVDSKIGNGARTGWMDVYETVRQEYLDRDRNLSISKDRCVEWDLLLADFWMSREPDRCLALLARAKTTSVDAAAQNPSSIQLHLQAAVLAAQAGDWKEVATRLDTVESIDKVTPHIDRKLMLAFVRVPKSTLDLLGPFDDAERIGGTSNQVRGEPVFQRLRRLPQLSE